MSKKVLLVDDEKTLAKALKFNLEKEGYQVDCAYDGEEALAKVEEISPDLIVLDLMLPKLDGFEVCQKVRRHHSIPIIMLTAKTEDIDKILGLELGADDYMTKPFNPRELAARIKAIFRRSTAANSGTGHLVEAHGLKVDLFRHKAWVGGDEVDLTAKEFALLSLLIVNPGRVYSREQLLKQVWGYDYYGDARTVDVHIRHLREKLEEDPGNPRFVVTVWGSGYKFREG